MAEIKEIANSQGQSTQGSRQAGGVQTAAQAAGDQEGGTQGSLKQKTGAGTQAPPQLPPRALRLSSVQDETIKEYFSKIKSEVGNSNKNIQAANYRLTSLDKMVPQVSRALSEKHNPKGPIVQSLLNQILSVVQAVDDILAKLEEANINVNVTLDLLKDYGESDSFNPTHFSDDIEYTRKNLRYKIDKLQNEFTIRKNEIENYQSLIALAESRIQKSGSVSSSHNSSPARPLVRSNADSLKPPILNYSEATVTSVAEHLQRVSDWVNNIFPNGYNFPNYLSNFISSIDKQLSIKAERFSSCKTEDDVADVLDELMEL